MPLKHITLTRLLSWKSCKRWTEERILEAAGGRRRMTPLEVANLPKVCADDKLWVLLRSEVLPDKELRLFACWCADRALRAVAKAGRQPDKRYKAVVRIARAFAQGRATAEELKAAEWAVPWVWVAGWAAPWAVQLAAHSAAYSATEAATEAAVCSARSAACSARKLAELGGRTAERAAWATERAAQLRHLKHILKRLAKS